MQLANVPRPWVIAQRRFRIGIERQLPAAQIGCAAVEQLARKAREILRTVSERRHDQRDGADSKIQILPEPSFAQETTQILVAPSASPWVFYTTLSNGFASNVHFDQEDRDAYGVVLGSGVRYDGDDFTINYEIAGHRYTNTARWDRISQMIAASIERDLSDKWEFHTEGQIGFKGTSEDRDVVDQDFEISPRLEYQPTPDRRLRLFTTHRLKRYTNAPETNALKHYIGAKFREILDQRRYWEFGGRYETNDERADRGDYRRWTYWVEHAFPVTSRDTLMVHVRYRFRRYTARFVEIDDEDHLRLDHRWIPSIGWSRSLGPDFDLRVDYTYESNYSNDPDREYRAHLLWSGIGVRW